MSRTFVLTVSELHPCHMTFHLESKNQNPGKMRRCVYTGITSSLVPKATFHRPLDIAPHQEMETKR